MSQSAAVPTSTGGPTAPDADETRLHGHWLVTARISWVVVSLTLLVLNIIAFPDTYGAYFTFTPAVLQELHRLGLSPTLYSVLEVLIDIVLTQVVYLLLGLWLVLRRSNDRMALFCAFTLVTFGSADAFYNFNNGDVVPALAANPILHVVTLLLFGAGETSLVVFFYLFPSGQFAPRWTRWAALLVVAYYLAVVFFPTLPSNAGGPATYLVPLFLLTAGIAQVYRYRRVSTPRERQQTKWVVFGFALVVLIFAVYIPISALIPPSIQNDPVLGNLNPFFPVALALIPTFIVIAITPSRLWDIDTLINKTLVYGSLTGLLGALYAALLVSLESLTGLISKQASQPVVLVISTLAIAAQSPSAC
jgi:hypothetical protein